MALRIESMSESLNKRKTRKLSKKSK